MQVSLTVFLKNLHFLPLFLARTGDQPVSVDEDDVFSDPHDLLPRDHDPLLGAEAEKTALQGNDDGGQAPVGNVEFDLRHASELFSVANVYDLFFSEILTAASLHTRLLKVIHPIICDAREFIAKIYI